MSDSDETERFESQNISSVLVEDAGPWAHGEKKQLIVDALKQRAYGDGVVDTEAVIEASREQLEATISAFERVEREFSNFPPAAKKVEVARIERTHEVARVNHGLRKEVEAAERSGPEERVDEDALIRLEQETIHNGESVFPEHGRVQELAQDGVTGKELVALLRERNPDEPAELFEEGSPGPQYASARTDGGEVQ